MSLQKALYTIRGAAHEQRGLADQCVHAPKLKASSLQNAADLDAAADALEQAAVREVVLRAEVETLRTLLQAMLNVAENADETGYVTDVGFVDLDKLHEEVRTALKS